MKNIYYIKTNYGAHKNISEIVLVAKRRGERSIGLPWFFKIHKLFRVVYSKTPSMWLPRSYMRYIVGVDHIQKSIQSRWKILVGAHIVYTAWRCICYYCVGQHRYQYGSSCSYFCGHKKLIGAPRSSNSCVELLPILLVEREAYGDSKMTTVRGFAYNKNSSSLGSTVQPRSLYENIYCLNTKLYCLRWNAESRDFISKLPDRM